MIPQLQQETPVSSVETVPQWALGTKIVFRFIFSYFLLYIYPRAVGSLRASRMYAAGPSTRLSTFKVPPVWCSTGSMNQCLRVSMNSSG